PFAWAEGISVWPTEAVRLFAALLCLHLIVSDLRKVRENDRKLEDGLRLKPLADFPRWPAIRRMFRPPGDWWRRSKNSADAGPTRAGSAAGSQAAAGSG